MSGLDKVAAATSLAIMADMNARKAADFAQQLRNLAEASKASLGIPILEDRLTRLATDILVQSREVTRACTAARHAMLGTKSAE